MPHEEAQWGKTVPKETVERDVIVFESFQAAIEQGDIRTLTRMARMLLVEMDRRLIDKWNSKTPTPK